jgi:hypothetical protein
VSIGDRKVFPRVEALDRPVLAFDDLPASSAARAREFATGPRGSLGTPKGVVVSKCGQR